MKSKVGIVGAGINGLSLALVLAERGCEVTIFDPKLGGGNNSGGLEWQIVRTHYAAAQGYVTQAASAIEDWRRLFEILGRNYFLPMGISSISRHQGDWSDQLLHDLRQNGVAFRLLSAEQVGVLYPGFELAGARFAMVSDRAGIIDAQRLLHAIADHLRRSGFAHFLQQGVEAVEGGRVWTTDQAMAFDYVIVTADHQKLMPRSHWELSRYTSCYCDLIIPGDYEFLWRYAPAWVDLGGGDHLWGIPRITGGRLRIASGGLTVRDDDENAGQRAALIDSYSTLIRDFDAYSIDEFQQRHFYGRADGRLQLMVEENVIGLQGDGGHGFKFAASHSFAIAEALETGLFHRATRRVAGIA